MDSYCQTLERRVARLEKALAKAERNRVDAVARFEAIYRGALTAVFVMDAVGEVVDANPAGLELLGRERDDLLGARIASFVHEDDRLRVDALVRELLAGDAECLRTEHRFVRGDGRAVWVLASVSLVRDADGRLAFSIVMAQDVTDRKAAEEALQRQAQLNEHQALHDALTGLPNRTLFRQRIEQQLAAAGGDGACLAVAMMDLDCFKEINESLGHQAGDELLMEMAERLRTCLRASDTVARLGGDEFGLLICNFRDPQDVVSVIEKVRAAVAQPVQIGQLTLSVAGSIGVAMYPQDGEDVETLVRTADIAMYCAKDTGAGYAFYDAAHAEADPTRLTMVGELRRALEREELVLFYQPKAALRDGAVESVEALLRWQHPDRGLMSPDQFIPLAERSGLINPVTLYVIDHALEQCRAWERDGLVLDVSVNVSARSLLDVGFPQQVHDLLSKWGVDAARLELEITESTMLSDPLRTRQVLDQLTALGLVISIDDFGTGYSSLAHLSQLPVHEIKIDRSFVMNMEASDHHAVIVRSTIDLARNLGLMVVAEGVENQQVWRELRRLGCTLAQGYFLSRPVPADELTAWLREHEQGTALKQAA